MSLGACSAARLHSQLYAGLPRKVPFDSGGDANLERWQLTIEIPSVRRRKTSRRQYLATAVERSGSPIGRGPVLRRLTGDGSNPSQSTKSGNAGSNPARSLSYLQIRLHLMRGRSLLVFNDEDRTDSLTVERRTFFAPVDQSAAVFTLRT